MVTQVRSAGAIRLRGVSRRFKILHDRSLTLKEIAAKAAELVYPSKSSWKGELVLVFQKIESLHKACPTSRGDWYFTGDYPTRLLDREIAQGRNETSERQLSFLVST